MLISLPHEHAIASLPPSIQLTTKLPCLLQKKNKQNSADYTKLTADTHWPQNLFFWYRLSRGYKNV